MDFCTTTLILARKAPKSLIDAINGKPGALPRLAAEIGVVVVIALACRWWINR